MAGTQVETEGLPSFVCETPDEASSNIQNSVEGIQVSSLQDGALCYVRSSSREYRWFEDSLTAPAFPDVLIPDGQSVLVAGRWHIVPITNGGASFNQFIQFNGVPLPQEPSLNFVSPGFDVSDDAGNTRTDVTILTDVPVDIGSANAEGSANELARADHVHDHADQGGGTLHEVATQLVAGFMSAADKVKLDNLVQGLTTIQDEGAPLPQQPFLNFIGATVTVTNDALNTRTDVTIEEGTPKFETSFANNGNTNPLVTIIPLPHDAELYTFAAWIEITTAPAAGIMQFSAVTDEGEVPLGPPIGLTSTGVYGTLAVANYSGATAVCQIRATTTGKSGTLASTVRAVAL